MSTRARSLPVPLYTIVYKVYVSQQQLQYVLLSFGDPAANPLRPASKIKGG